MSRNNSSRRHGALVQVSRQAMATEFVVMMPERSGTDLDAAVSALEELDEIEARLTVYRESSEISRLNREAAGQPVPLSGDTFELLRRAICWSRWSEGAFDVTAGPLVEAWGFTARRGRKPSSEEIREAMTRVGFGHLELDDSAHTARFRRPGMAVNLGAIGKGFALDRVADRLRDAGARDFLIHGGQSSVLAAGDQIPGSGVGWAVGLAHPSKPQRRLAGVWLRDAAIGTSGSGKQFFHHRGRRFGHVIDPRTGQPAGDLLSLTVILGSATDADACATGLFVAGSEQAKRLATHSAGDCETPRDAAGAEPLPLIMVHPAGRQDQVSTEALGGIRWVEPPADAGADMLEGFQGTGGE